MIKYIIFDRDDTICAQPSLEVCPDLKYSHFVHPQIEQFLTVLKQDGFTNVMASTLTRPLMKALNEKLGIDKYFDFGHLFGSQFAECGGKKLQLLKKYLPTGFLDNAVMIGNNSDIGSVIASIPIFVVYCGMQRAETKYWEVKQVYRTIQELFKQSKMPAQNFDEIFAQGSNLDDSVQRTLDGTYAVKKKDVIIDGYKFTFEHRFPDKSLVEEMKEIETIELKLV